MSDVILAAGAIVWRKHKEKFTEVAIIHRPKYDDWTFPKGKCEIGEALIACAHREVFEETNITTEFGPFLGKVEYASQQGMKQVSYWSAKVIDEKPFTPNSEVDQIKWVAVTKVSEMLSMETDREILDSFIKLKFDTKPFVLLRHAKAVSRDEWQGDDDDRPLEDLGINQSKRLLSTYKVFNLEQIHTSDAIRCYSTVEPIANGLNLKLEVTAKLSESTYRKDKDKAFDYAKELLKSEINAMICSHNPILPKMLNKLTKKSDVDADEEKLSPADGWVIHRDGKEIIQIDRLDAPLV
ncbi:8-oxo-dGTP diphosphatase [Candidatus Nanopelagicus limnes]|uniref:8-oxo-dGTP diphosphatase n=1 Tax=Candidatus Nanopelagicus limnae TaxID=1884634 RepID=A0A249JZ72_9ACTN|nr:NUDIX domain-containing protein [Candidatus Nanopelagicus limnes]ASY09810.1 8-oxo-dGTP diphosphatase [Candidatus Nanopelagicus limnes]